MHTLDISFYSGGEYATIEAITRKYPKCKWYASDVGPIGDVGPKYTSHCYLISSANTVIDIVREVNDSSELWIRHCGKTVKNDYTHVYVADVVTQRWEKSSVDAYQKITRKFTGKDAQIFLMCVAGNKPRA
jgi:hypothetical protein